MKCWVGALAEIAALEQRCNKNRFVRQGMMRQVLTGRMCLVKPTRTTGARRVQKYKRTQDLLAGTFRNRRVYAWLADGSCLGA